MSTTLYTAPGSAFIDLALIGYTEGTPTPTTHPYAGLRPTQTGTNIYWGWTTFGPLTVPTHSRTLVMTIPVVGGSYPTTCTATLYGVYYVDTPNDVELSFIDNEDTLNVNGNYWGPDVGSDPRDSMAYIAKADIVASSWETTAIGGTGPR